MRNTCPGIADKANILSNNLMHVILEQNILKLNSIKSVQK